MSRAGRGLVVLIIACATVMLLPSTASAATFTVTNTNDSGPGSLRQAIINANATAAADTINITATGTLTVQSELPLIINPLTMNGPSPGTFTVDANAKGGGFVVDIGVVASISRLRITGANNSGIRTGGTLTLSRVTITGNSSGSAGGGISNVLAGANLTLNDSVVSSNNAPEGGGIFNLLGTVVINSSQLSDNTATNGGGAINNIGPLTMNDGSLSGNHAFSGAGLLNRSDATLNRVLIDGNAATGFEGGGLFNCGTAGCSATPNMWITDSVIENNSAAFWGGGILGGLGGTVTIESSILTANSAIEGGGGIFNFGTMTIDQTTVDGNTALQAAGIDNQEASLVVTNSTISNNNATGTDANHGPGGGLFNTGNANLTNVTISGNSAAANHSGGGIFNCSASCSGSPSPVLNLLNVTLANNSANFGGGIDNDAGGSATLKNTIVANSPSGGNCHGLLISNGHNLSSDSTCTNFTAAGDQNNANPDLGTLAPNGGATPTHALLMGSFAIDAGDNVGCPATDQRGWPRPVDGNGDLAPVCDVGAFEAPQPAGNRQAGNRQRRLHGGGRGEDGRSHGGGRGEDDGW